MSEETNIQQFEEEFEASPYHNLSKINDLEMDSSLTNPSQTTKSKYSNFS